MSKRFYFLGVRGNERNFGQTIYSSFLILFLGIRNIRLNNENRVGSKNSVPKLEVTMVSGRCFMLGVKGNESNFGQTEFTSL